MELSRRSSGIQGSLTLEIDAKAKAMRAAGESVIGFGAGEPDFDTPAFIIQAAKDALDHGLTRYTPASGTLDLKKAICARYQQKYGVTYQPNQVVVSNGAKHSLFNVFQALLNPGDEVIIPAPFWLSYPEMVKMADGLPVLVHATAANGFLLTPDQLEAAITPRTKAIILNNPSNPTGAVYTRTQLEALCAVCAAHDLFIVSDEIYEELLYDGNQMTCVASLGENLYRRTIVISGMSKSYAMTGWRIGYALCRPDIAKMMSNFQSHATSNPNSIAQYASAVALTADQSFLVPMLAAFDERRKEMCALINAIDGLRCNLPGGAFYVMMDISALLGKRCGDRVIDGSMAFAAALLEQQKVALVPGLAFGIDDHVRLSYATGLDNIRAGIARIAAFVKELQ